MALELYPERQCATCTLSDKERYGCNGDAPFEDMGSPNKTCIRRPIYDDPVWFSEMFGAYRKYKNGFLPNPGSYMEQPAAYLDVINIIDATIHECDMIKEEERKAKEGRKPKSPKRGR